MGILADFLPIIGIALAAIAAWFVNNKVQQRKGAKKNAQKAKEADHEHADEIRDNVERNLDERVRDLDGAGFRD